MDTTPRDLDALLAQAGWAKALARSLVRDPDRAEDLVQRAWLAALRNPPDEAIPPRRWLAAVMRNFVRDDARESASRAERERQVARSERTPGSDPFDDAASAQARLLAAVRELPEPSRSAVWARYYEGLAPREIAARDGVPVETVKTRIARGLQSLRQRFDREHGGDRAAWVLAVLPLAAEPGAASALPSDPVSSGQLATTTLTTLAMDAKLKVAAVLAAIACGSAVWIAMRGGDVAPLAEPLAVSVNPELASPDGGAQEPETPATSGASRGVIETARPQEATPVADAAKTRDGIVLDLERRPVAGLEVVDGWNQEPIVLGEDVVRSDERGRFQIPGSTLGHVTARGDGWVTVIGSQAAQQESSGELCIVVARPRDVAGIVVDANGAPVENALVSHHLAEHVRRSLGEVLRWPVEVSIEARTDALGRFGLTGVPDAEAVLRARAENHRNGSKDLTAGPAADVVITLPPPEAGSVVLRGRVLDESGAGIARAFVVIADASTRSRADGRFELPVPRATLDAWQRTTRNGRPPTGPTSLVVGAIVAGRLPARLELPELAELERIAPTEEFLLVLGDEPLVIEGRVVDSEKRPVADARIEVVDEDWFGVVEMEFDGMELNGQLTVEQFLRGGFAAPPIWTDADGHFAVGGLQPREYRLDVVANALPAARRTDPIRPGAADVEIVLDTSGAHARLAGRVVDRRGEAVGGVRIVVLSIVDGREEHVVGPFVTADSAGRFAFDRVRGSDFRFEVDGGEAVPARVDVRPGDALDDLVVVVARRARVQVDLGERTDLASAARFLDEAGRPVAFTLTRDVVGDLNTSSVSWSTSVMTLVGGRSEVGWAAEGQYLCVLEKSGVEVMRIPVSLGGKGVTVVRP